MWLTQAEKRGPLAQGLSSSAVTWAGLDVAVGVIATTGLDLVWKDVANLVDIVEIEPQTLWTPRADGGWDIAEAGFGWVAGCGKPTTVHGVGFPVGGCEPPDPQGVALTAACAERLGAVHWSEHLSFNRVQINGRLIDAGFLLPPAQTEAGVEAAVDHIQTYRRAARRPFLIETGVNYLRPRTGELSDGTFIAAIAERADCGILLDLHNLISNQRNGRQIVDDVLGEVPLDRVLEVHVAGGFEFQRYYLDAHVSAPDPELLAKLDAVIPMLPNLQAVVFEAVPESLISLGTDGLRGVLETLHRICDHSRGQHPVRKPTPAEVPRITSSQTALRPRIHCADGQLAPPARDIDAQTTAEWERQLAAYTARVRPDPPVADPGLALLRTLADQARLGQIALARPDLLESLIRIVGVTRTEHLLADYLSTYSPKRWSSEEGDQFATWFDSVGAQ
jgi:uncharacterized protein (UPF0276 family)